MSRHTPGPWVGVNEVDYEPPEMRKCVVIQNDVPDQDQNARHIAFAFGDGGQSEANARLIAAAPDLLAACEAAFDFTEGGLGVDDLGEYHRSMSELVKQLENAIAKAKGETP